MSQNSPDFQIGLRIHLQSFTLPKRIAKDKDEIRVSITTIPEERKQNFSIQKKNINNVDHVFEVNITNNTKKVIIVFRKKTLLSKEAIIASTIIHCNDFPKLPQVLDESNLDSAKTDIKIMNIYEPYQQKRKVKHEKHSEFFEDQCQYAETPVDKKNREIIGEMQVQLSYTSRFDDINQVPVQKNKSKEIVYENNEQESPNKMFRDLMNNRI